jgi:hypothetical protein
MLMQRTALPYLVFLLILGGALGFLLWSLFGQPTRYSAQDRAMLAIARDMAREVNRYRRRHGHYPATLELVAAELPGGWPASPYGNGPVRAAGGPGFVDGSSIGTLWYGTVVDRGEIIAYYIGVNGADRTITAISSRGLDMHQRGESSAEQASREKAEAAAQPEYLRED